MNKRDRIYVTGHKGMVGSAICRALGARGFTEVVTSDIDLRNQASVRDYFNWRIDYVFLCAGKVAGIKANNERPAEFLYDNLMIATNVIHQAYLAKVNKLCYFASSCIYPRDCPQPMKEEYLLTGKLEPTNEGYAIAKLAGCELARQYTRQYGFSTITLMPCNLYGLNDHFDLERAHVLSSLVKRFVDARDNEESSVKLWGTGKACREFMNVDDLAEAAIMAMERRTDPAIMNVGTGTDVTIAGLAGMIRDAAGYKGNVEWDSNMPDGMPKKRMDITQMLHMGFRPRINLFEGVTAMVRQYEAYKKNR